MLHFINKKRTSPEVERLERLLARLERKWQVTFKEFIESSTSDEVIRRVANLIEAGNVAGALDLIDSFVVRMAASVIPPSFTMVGNSKVEQLAKKVAKLRPTVAVSFDPSYPRAAALQTNHQLDFVKEFTTEQRAATNQALAEAFESGANPRKAARVFKDSIGLTQRQLKAVDNYRRLLSEGSLEALGRELRDRRSDTKVESLFRAGKMLSSDEIDRMVEHYRKQYLTYRSESIARTEAGRTLSEANREAFQQTVEDAEIPDELVIRTWNATKDKRTRDSHVAMDGQKVIGINTLYTTGAGNKLLYPCDPNGKAEEVVQCRCVETQELGEWPD